MSSMFSAYINYNTSYNLVPDIMYLMLYRKPICACKAPSLSTTVVSVFSVLIIVKSFQYKGWLPVTTGIIPCPLA